MVRVPNTSQVDKYHEFVASIRKTPPVETEFAVGQVVAFVNDYGVIFDNLTIVGFADDDSFYGRFIYLDSDSYWFPVHPGSLRVIDEDGKYEIRKGEVVYKGGDE
jgi:hypothetical protein